MSTKSSSYDNWPIPAIHSKSEQRYIIKRTIQAKIQSLCFYICRVFPIKKKLISVCTFEGKGGFGCNPKYIVQELHRRDTDYEFVWFVNDMSKEFPEYIKKVPNTIWSRAYWLTRSKLWIDNYRKPYGTKKRKGQFYFQTWHAGIGFKKIGLLRGDAFSRMAYIVSKSDSDMIDCTMIDCKWCELMYPKGLLYDGEMLYSGAPRCDGLFGDRTEIRARLRQKHGLYNGIKILLFAPTFRESSHGGKRGVYIGRWSIDLKRVMTAFEKRFGGKWVIFIRVHPQIAAEAKGVGINSIGDYIYDVSIEDDMYEILTGVDALITDYSSTIFEASLGDIPAFMYADDIEEYSNYRGGLHFTFHKDPKEPVYNGTGYPKIKARFPYPIAYNNDELERNILDFNTTKYLKGVRAFEKDMGINTQGNASKICADYISHVVYANL